MSKKPTNKSQKLLEEIRLEKTFQSDGISVTLQVHCPQFNECFTKGVLEQEKLLSMIDESMNQGFKNILDVFLEDENFNPRGVLEKNVLNEFSTLLYKNNLFKGYLIFSSTKHQYGYSTPQEMESLGLDGYCLHEQLVLEMSLPYLGTVIAEEKRYKSGENTYWTLDFNKSVFETVNINIFDFDSLKKLATAIRLICLEAKKAKGNELNIILPKHLLPSQKNQISEPQA